MKIFFFIFLLAMTGCSHADNVTENPLTSIHCDFDFHLKKECRYQVSNHNIVVKIKPRAIADDETGLNALQVVNNGQKSLLTITSDTTLLDGDVGYISFADINFDAVPDLAITTSFGTPNLYLDYWLYDAIKNTYVRVGNFPRLTLHPANQTLSAEVKINAAQYKRNTFTWNGHKLVQGK